MQTIVGQAKLLSIIDSYTIQTLPKTLMFIGHKGCGKHTFTKYIVEKFNFDFIEITKEVSSEELVRYGEFSKIADAELENSDTIIDTDTLVEISKRKKDKAA